MLCVAINGPTVADAERQIAEASKYADLVEIRLDGFTTIDDPSIKKLRTQFSCPMIFTLRSSLQGGNYKLSEETRLADIRRLAKLNPEYFDLESHVPAHFIEEIARNYPKTKLILSYHNFEKTPEDLEELLKEMQKTPASFYKIAAMANSSLDVMRLLCWAKRAPQNVIAVSMGPYGQISRILAPLIGRPITYASLSEDQKSAPGQLEAKTLIERFNYRTLNKDTKLYGLIGYPIEQSLSDATHNSLLKALNLNAVYVKIPVQTPELAEFFRLAKKLPFSGLSVTMPLKEAVLSYVDEISEQAEHIQALNTLQFQNGKIIGHNTDSIGALNAIESAVSVKGKRVAIIGAGGAAKAIAYEACQRGALVTIINRSVEKAHQIAMRFGCAAFDLEKIGDFAATGYDILINSTPLAMPIAADHILPETFVMDIKTRMTNHEFFTAAKERGCRLIFGHQMFVEQAIGQFSLWFNDLAPPSQSRPILEKACRAILHE